MINREEWRLSSCSFTQSCRKFPNRQNGMMGIRQTKLMIKMGRSRLRMLRLHQAGTDGLTRPIGSPSCTMWRDFSTSRPSFPQWLLANGHFSVSRPGQVVLGARRSGSGGQTCSSTGCSGGVSYSSCSSSDSSSNRCNVVLNVTYRFMTLRRLCSLRTNRFSPS